MSVKELKKHLDFCTVNQDQEVIVFFTTVSHCQGADELTENRVDIDRVQRINNKLIIVAKQWS